MGLLQTLWRHLSLKLRRKEEENLTPSQMELKLFIESLTYNPMMNHLIINTIFKHASQDDLLRFRLVCKTWHEHATSRLLLKDPIHRVVTRESELQRLLDLSRKSEFFPIQSFYIKIPSLGSPPHALFKTLSLPCIVSLKIIIESKNFPVTVKTIGMHMKTLKHLVICRIPEMSYEAIGYASAPGGANPSNPPGKLPNLLSLTLRNAKPTRNFLATYDGAVIDLLRAASGSLRALELYHWGMLSRILREGSFGGVTSLKILGSRLSEGDVSTLIKKKGLMLDRFTAKVDKSVNKILVKELLDKRVQGSSRRITKGV